MKKFILLLTILSTSAFAALSDLDKADVTSTNILKNPGFESGLADWTKTGGTWALQSSGSKLGFGKGSLCWDSNAAGQKLKSTIATIPNALKGKNGEMKLSIQTPTGTSTHILRITDGTNQVADSVNVGTSTSFQPHSLNMAIPSSGGVGIEIESVASNEPEICLDLGYIGEATNLRNVAQAYVVGSVKIEGCSGAWGFAISGSFASTTGGITGCTFATTGSAQSPGSNIPAIKFASLPAGEYEITYEGLVANNGANTSQFQFSDGTTTAREISTVDYAQSGTPGFKQSFSYTTAQSNVTWQVLGKGATIGILYGTTASPGVITVRYWPTQSQLAVNSLQADYDWTSFTPTTSQFGSPSAVAFYKSKDGGDLLIRGNFTTGSLGSGSPYIDMPDGLLIDDTKYPSGVVSILGRMSRGVGAPAGSTYWVNLVYNGSDNTKIYFSTGNNGDAPTTVISDASVQFNTSEIQLIDTTRIKIKGWSKQQKAPVLVGSVTSGASGALRIESATIANNGTCSIASQTGNWISSVNHVGSGGCEVNFVAGTFSSTPVCSFNSLGGGRSFVHSGSNTASQLPYVENYRADTDTTPDADFTMMCIGTKP